MKKCLLLLCLMSCGSPITGGAITGKYTAHHSISNGNGHAADAVCYYLTVFDNGKYGTIEVNEKAWNQATTGMKWPFEVK